ncbi:general transcription factor II-I repeat domain-containing protein 2-like [Lycorma delicatula]|uniref:general transcription factor II-I repeat domain-containing protein 2-like n=1 Tax=Lycorma delicatula TaxID=130591 RepID=UPI003F514093
MSLSRNTVMRRTEGMRRNLEDILHENINKCVVLAVQFDESTDYIGTAQLCVFIRMVFDDMLVTEELLTIIPMHDRTRGQDIFDLFKNYIARTNFPICKLVSITTDGAPAMIGNKIANHGNSLLCVKVMTTFQILLTIIVSYILKYYVQKC